MTRLERIMTSYEVYNEQTRNTISHPIDFDEAMQIIAAFTDDEHTYALRIVDISPDLRAILDLYRVGGAYDLDAYFSDLHISPNDYNTPALRCLVNAQLDWMDAQNVRAGHPTKPAPRLVRYTALVVGLLATFAPVLLGVGW